MHSPHSQGIFVFFQTKKGTLFCAPFSLFFTGFPASIHHPAW